MCVGCQILHSRFRGVAGWTSRALPLVDNVTSVGCNDQLPLRPSDLRQVICLVRKRYQHEISNIGYLPTRPMSPSSSSSTIPKIRAGDGRIVVEFDPYRGHTFAQLSCTYPLKLLSPRSKEDSVAIVYVLSYGGGLVGGDEVSLEVGVREGASLMLLSQVRLSSYLRCGACVWWNGDPHLRFFVFFLVGFHESVQGQVHNPLSHPKTSGTA